MDNTTKNFLVGKDMEQYNRGWYIGNWLGDHIYKDGSINDGVGIRPEMSFWETEESAEAFLKAWRNVSK